MASDLAIGCECGALRGAARGVPGARGNHLICYCDDCQAFAHHLGRPERILDEHGGSEIFQVSPACVALDTGVDRIACIRLAPGGLVRWYASCCRTPIGNTLATPRVPFVGLVLRRVSSDPERRARDALLGPVRARIQARFAVGDRTRLDAHDGVPMAQWLVMSGLLLRAWLSGAHRRSPLFTAAGDPIATPHVLTAEELRAATRRG
jgi:hypothetical protein